MVPQGDTDEKDKPLNKMAVKVTKKVKYAITLYHKINVARSTLYTKGFMLFSKSAQFLDYAALLNSFLEKQGCIAQFFHHYIKVYPTGNNVCKFH